MRLIVILIGALLQVIGTVLVVFYSGHWSVNFMKNLASRIKGTKSKFFS